MSPNPYFDAFVEPIDLQKVDLTLHWTAGLKLFEWNGQLILGGMDLCTPASRIPRWRTRLWGATLVKVGDVPASTVQEVHIALVGSLGTPPLCPLFFAFPEIRQDISHDGLPIMHSGDFSQATHDQLNDQWDYFTLSPCMQRVMRYLVSNSRGVLNYVTRVMHLTWGKLLKQNDWHDWQELEFLQLNQYFAQGMFGDPSAVTSVEAVFYLVWTYNIKTLDG
jgi:hypothetical protein